MTEEISNKIFFLGDNGVGRFSIMENIFLKYNNNSDLTDELEINAYIENKTFSTQFICIKILKFSK